MIKIASFSICMPSIVYANDENSMQAANLAAELEEIVKMNFNKHAKALTLKLELQSLLREKKAQRDQLSQKSSRISNEKHKLNSQLSILLDKEKHYSEKVKKLELKIKYIFSEIDNKRRKFKLLSVRAAQVADALKKLDLTFYFPHIFFKTKALSARGSRGYFKAIYEHYSGKSKQIYKLYLVLVKKHQELTAELNAFKSILAKLNNKQRAISLLFRQTQKEQSDLLSKLGNYSKEIIKLEGDLKSAILKLSLVSNASLKAMLNPIKQFENKIMSITKKDSTHENKNNSRASVNSFISSEEKGTLAFSDLERKYREKDVYLSSRYFSNPQRKRAQIIFSRAKKLLPLPVVGRIVHSFGGHYSFGGRVDGNIIVTRVGGNVISPFDGKVVYAGILRSYNKVVILDVGNKYNIVLAGMGEINVPLGKFVKTGEVIGTMGPMKKFFSRLFHFDKAFKKYYRVVKANITIDSNNSDIARGLKLDQSLSLLYVEFIHNGVPVDPANWWTNNYWK